MSTAALPGFLSQVYLSFDAGSSFNPVGELRDVTLSIERDTIDASSHNDQGWKANLQGLAQWSMSAEYMYLKADAPQNALYAALINRTPFKVRYYPEGTHPATAGQDQWDGDAIITSWELAGPNDDVQATSVEVLGDGALTQSTAT